MSVEQQIKAKLLSEFAPVYMELINESSMHNVPAGSESHFKLTMVSDKFNEVSRIQRQRMVNNCLSDLLTGPVHAFSQRLYTPEEWGQGQPSVASPDCRGGSRHDS